MSHHPVKPFDQSWASFYFYYPELHGGPLTSQVSCAVTANSSSPCSGLSSCRDCLVGMLYFHGGYDSLTAAHQPSVHPWSLVATRSRGWPTAPIAQLVRIAWASEANIAFSNWYLRSDRSKRRALVEWLRWGSYAALRAQLFGTPFVAHRKVAYSGSWIGWAWLNCFQFWPRKRASPSIPFSKMSAMSAQVCSSSWEFRGTLAGYWAGISDQRSFQVSCLFTSARAWMNYRYSAQLVDTPGRSLLHMPCRLLISTGVSAMHSLAVSFSSVIYSCGWRYL